MLQLQPQEYFTIVRVLEDHTDSGTYYVQAVVKKSKDGSVLATVNLTDQGDRRFTGDYQIPEDSTNEGFLIDITTSVYSDSGYTTKATNYGDSNNVYLVQQRWNSFLGGGGAGGGANISDIRKVIKEEIKKIEIPEYEEKEVDLSSLSSEISKLMIAIKGITIPEPEKLDITPALNEILRVEKEIKRMIEEKPVTPMADLNPIAHKNSKENEKMMNGMREAYMGLLGEIRAELGGIKQFIDKTGKRFDVSDKMRQLLSGDDIKPFEIKETPKKKRLFLNR